MNDLVLAKVYTTEVFTKDGGVDEVLSDLEKRVAEFKPDTTTAKGRGEIITFAANIARSKTGLKKLGNDFLADQKAKMKAVDKERTRLWDAIEAMQKEVRKPVTEWEEKDKERIAGHEDKIKKIVELGNQCAIGLESLEFMGAECHNMIEEASDSVLYSWQEFEARAKKEYDTTIKKIKVAIEKRKEHDAEQVKREEDQAELTKLRKEAAEREQKDRKDKIAADATGNAKCEETAKETVEKNERLRIESLKEAQVWMDNIFINIEVQFNQYKNFNDFLHAVKEGKIEHLKIE